MLSVIITTLTRGSFASHDGLAPQWIWDAVRPFGPDGFFRREFNVEGKVRGAWIQMSGDDGYSLYLNGEKIAAGGFRWYEVDTYEITEKLIQARNVIAAECRSPVEPAGFILRCTVNYEDRPSQVFVSDSSWKMSRAASEGWERPSFDDSGWGSAVPIGEPPVGPWGMLPFIDLIEDGVRLSLESVSVADEVAAGDPLSLTIIVKPDGRPRADYPVYLSLRREKTELVPEDFSLSVPSSTWSPGQSVTIGPIDILISKYAPTGEYELRFGVRRLPYSNLAGIEPVVGKVKVKGREGTVKPPKAEVKDHNGSPAVWINGKPVFAVVYSDVGSPSIKHARRFRAAGVHLYEQCSAGSLGWLESGEQDFSSVDHSIMTLLEGDPDAYFFPRVWLEPPDWWLNSHPDELAKYAATSEDKIDDFGGTRWPSMASEAWKKEAGEAFRSYIRHIQDSSYGDRVIGYHICAGIYGEWHYLGSQYLPDTGRPMTEAFRRWLRREYRGDVSALRKVWNDPAVSFENAQVPGQEARFETDFGIFRDPSKDRRVIDYYRCHHEVLTDAILHFARIVKEESEGRSLVGAFYGYTSNVLWPQEGGHWNLDAILDSPCVDFLCSPHSYVGRHMGEDGGLRALPASIRLHGKFFMDESDDRSYLAPGTRGFTIATDHDETVAVMRREFANVLTQNFGHWWFDMDSCWFDDDRLMAEVAAMQKAGERSMGLPRKSAAQIAVFVSEDSIFYVSNWKSGRDKVTDPLLNEQWRELFKMGAPFDLYELKDIANPKFPEYKCYVFLNCFYVPKAVREAIEGQVKRDGRVAVWIYAPGLMDEDGLGAQKMMALTGIKLMAEDRETAPVQDPKVPIECRCPMAQDVPALYHFVGLMRGSGAKEWGLEMPVSPAIWCDDPTAIFLGASPATLNPNFCVKSFPDWTSVYAPGPVIPSSVLREIARLAGCHIYSESDDPLFCSWSYLAMHARTAGTKTFRLPRKCVVKDALTGKTLASDADGFSVEMKQHETRIFEMGRALKHESEHSEKAP